MKDLTSFGGSCRRQRKRTDSGQVLKDRMKSNDFRKGMKPIQEMPGFGDPKPEENKD